jgi:hypothetical protein
MRQTNNAEPRSTTAKFDINRSLDRRNILQKVSNKKRTSNVEHSEEEAISKLELMLTIKLTTPIKASLRITLSSLKAQDKSIPPNKPKGIIRTRKN